METQELVARLQTAYPGRDVQVVDKSDTAFVDEDHMPEQLVGIMYEDFLIIDPYQSECGRFDTWPSEYDIEEDDARAIALHNGLAREGSTPPAPAP